MVIDSIFRFSKEPTELPAFFEMCKQQDCKIKFQLESLVWDKGVLYSEEDGTEINSSLFVAGFITYLTMFQKYSTKHIEYLLKYAEKDDYVIDCKVV